MAYQEFRNGFKVQTGSAIDKRLLLSKAEMLTVEEDYTMPDEYFAVCKDDGKVYLYKASNTVDAETGKFRVIDDTLDKTNALINANTTAISTEEIRAKAAESELENAIENLDIPEIDANPETTGEEDSLTGIEINGTKYKITENSIEINKEDLTVEDYASAILGPDTITTSNGTVLNNPVVYLLNNYDGNNTERLSFKCPDDSDFDESYILDDLGSSDWIAKNILNYNEDQTGIGIDTRCRFVFYDTDTETGDTIRFNETPYSILAKTGGNTFYTEDPEETGFRFEIGIGADPETGDSRVFCELVEIPKDVIANPTLAGTESELTGLQIGDTAYKNTKQICQCYLALDTVHDTYSIKKVGTQTTITALDVVTMATAGIMVVVSDEVSENEIAKLLFVDRVDTSIQNTAIVYFTNDDTVITLDHTGAVVISTNGVQANPTLVGDEEDLTGLEVNGTKYKITGASSATGSIGTNDFTKVITYANLGNDSFSGQTLGIADTLPVDYPEQVQVASIGAVIDSVATWDYFTTQPLPYAVPYLELSGTGQFDLILDQDSNPWDGMIEYSTDLEDWRIWDLQILEHTTISSSEDGKLYLRGTDNTSITGYAGCYEFFEVNGSADISIYGCMEALLDYNKIMHGVHPVMNSYCFAAMFNGIQQIVAIGPDVFASRDKLTARGCYAYMFENCTSLTTAPRLPATTLYNECYREMFFECTSLSTIPALPATKLADSCYLRMFGSCSAIQISDTQTAEYQTPYRIPASGQCENPGILDTELFDGTGGPITEIAADTTYYTSNTVIS